jgi:branched-subunit amino acid transport protein AzlD
MDIDLTLLWIVVVFIVCKLLDVFFLNSFLSNNFSSKWAKAIANLFLGLMIIYAYCTNEDLNAKVIAIFFAVICFIEFCDVLFDNIISFLKKNKVKSHGGSFGNVLEAYYQETTIRKIRFEIAGREGLETLCT